MDVTPEEFVDRLLSPATHAQPSDHGNASDLRMELPPWFDEKKFKAGQKFFCDNIYGQVGSMLSGLVTIIAVPSILHVLENTKRSSSSFTAYRRYASTIMHVVSWHEHDLKPGSKSWQSLKAVRSRHLNSGSTARAQGTGTISQRDIALTQWGFIGYTLLRPGNLGIQSFDKDSWEGFNHLWRTLVHMLGLQDKYNLCIGTVEETREVCRILMERVFAPMVEFPPEPLEHMAYVILDGVWSTLPLSNPRAVWFNTKNMLGIPGYVLTEQDKIDFRRRLKHGEIKDVTRPVMEGWHTPQPRTPFNPEDFHLLSTVPEYKKLTLIEKCYLNTITFLSMVYTTTIGKYCLNGVIRLSLFFTEHFPILAFHRFGFGSSYVKMFAESVSDRTEPMSNAEVLKLYEKSPWYVKWNPFCSNKE